jgi:HEAT repeat protein
MQTAGAFGAALVALTALLVLLLLLTAVRKALRAASERRREHLESLVRPALLQYLAAEDPDPARLDVAGRGAGHSLDTLAAGLLPKLRGEDRDALARVLTDRGTIARARRRTRRPGAVRRARAAELLGAAGDAEALPDLRRLLVDKNADVRSAAARALGKLGDTDAVPSLLEVLDGPRPVPAGVVTMALLHMGPAASGALRVGVESSRPAPVRQVAAELLGRLGATEATDDLIRMVREDPDLQTRMAAAGALGRLGLPRAIEPLVEALSPQEPRALREVAATALGALGGPAAIDALDEALRGAEHGLARRCAEALVGCGGSAISRLELVADEGGLGSAEARAALDGVALAAYSRGHLAA